MRISTLGKRSEKRAVPNSFSRDVLFRGSMAVARQSFLIALIVLAPVCVLLIPPKLQAALGTITVNTLSDESTPGDHLCSLREAINNANSPGLDTTGGDCVVGTGIDTINFTVSGTITLTGGLPAVQNTLTVDGIGQSITVDGAHSFGVFVVNSGATFNLNNMTVAHGSSHDAGGLDNNGTSSVNSASFTGNSGFWGGAIDSEVGALNVTKSTFSANGAVGGGGITCGIRTGGGSVAVVNSTFSQNGGSDAGAILLAGCSVTVSGSTFFGNGGYGGAIFENGTGALTVANSTFLGNGADCGTVCTTGGSITILNSTFSGNGNGGAVANFHFNPGTSLTVSNSVLSTNTGGNCIGPIGNGGYNISDDGSCGFGTSTGANGQTLGDNVNPQLGSAVLQNNGGPTETIALQAGSPAIDAIPITHQCPTTDQRGVARQDNGESACDVGAYEFVDAVPTLVSGAFLIGDLDAAVGEHVTFWGAQWSKQNSLSGGSAPPSFKGFASHTPGEPPKCGDTWTTEPGNSSNPPSSVPSSMAVIVSSSIEKSGSTIAGNTRKVVIVRTDSGYAPDPGHPGTGTVVSEVCHQ
jgi:CSLREA domain-containing protein